MLRDMSPYIWPSLIIRLNISNRNQLVNVEKKRNMCISRLEGSGNEHNLGSFFCLCFNIREGVHWEFSTGSG